ncbi:MAG: DDE-type integrase/transposase/recombinase [archaeon]
MGFDGFFKKAKKYSTKITGDIENKIIHLRSKTGWGAEKINSIINEVSVSTIKRILIKNNLSNSNPNKKKRIKYIRWQREHPNSLWQADTSDQKVKDKYVLSIIDDCSRYSLAMTPLNKISTEIITNVFDKIIKIHGKPREILTDNGAVFGLKSKHSKFDRWCRRRGIKHIRSAIHSPTTSGKVERLFQTMINEMPFCNNDPELFRMRYNHFRPHTSLNNKNPSEVYFAFHKLF